MQELSLDQFNDLLKTDQITPYSIYGLDVDYQQYFSIDHYIKNQNDSLEKDQKLNILFVDIEVYTGNAGEFPKPNQAKYPISAITIYSTEEKIFKSFFLVQQININKFPNKSEFSKLIDYYKDELIKNEYIKESEELKIELQVFTSELDLIKTCWTEVKKIDPTILSGWNSDRFDYPYVYYRLGNLLNKNEQAVQEILSRFNVVKIHKLGEEIFIQIPEMPICDLLQLYKPRDEGGSNYGDKLSSYTLDNVADYELDLKKKEYKDEGMSIDTFYETDPVNFLLYNIIDVALVKNLNKKLRHIESHNLLRRLMKTAFSKSMTGSSALFDTYVNYVLNKNNWYTRFGIVEETNLSISEDALADVYIPKAMKKTIKDISQQNFRTITGRFPGAYVKESKAQVLTSKDGIIIDLDASSLYPSMIIQSNISFDTLFGRIIDPLCYKFLQIVENIFNTKGVLSIQIYSSIYDLCVKYVDRLSPQNKGEYVQYTYLILAFLLKKIEKSKKSFDELFHPKTIQDYLLLKRYFIPMIDLFDDIHEYSKEYNSFCNSYLINNEIPAQLNYLYIIEDVLQPSLKINKILVKDFKDYLEKNNLIVSLSGCLFVKHEVKEGLFIEFLKNLKSLRNEYEKKRDSYDENSDEYSFYDMRQSAVKITSNTTYGLFGQSTYRFSNKHLAKAITVQGRLTLKMAQIIAEMYLNSLEGK